MDHGNMRLIAKTITISVVWIGVTVIAVCTPRPLGDLYISAMVATALVSVWM